MIDAGDGKFIPVNDAALEREGVDLDQVGPYEEPPETAPDIISSRQFMIGCYQEGILTMVQNYVSQQAMPVQLAFNFSATFVREDPFLQAGFAALGKKPAEVDAFFLKYSKI